MFIHYLPDTVYIKIKGILRLKATELGWSMLSAVSTCMRRTHTIILSYKLRAFIESCQKKYIKIIRAGLAGYL